MPIDALQEETEVQGHLSRQGAMEGERANWESTWRDIDRLVDPQAQGSAFNRMLSPGTELGLDNFDATAIEGLNRWTAAIAGLTMPRNQRWHGLTVRDKDLRKQPAVQLWLEHANDRLNDCRMSPAAGFETQAITDIRQNGKYGTSPLWVDEMTGRSMFYRSIHLSEVFIDEDFRGRVDTAHRKFEMSVRQARQMFGEPALTDRMMQAWTNDNPAKRDDKFQFLHVLCPNAEYEPGSPFALAMPIRSMYIAIDEKAVTRRGGYRTMPLIVSRNIVSAGSKYGRSPAMSVLGTIKTAEEIAKTMLRSAHKAVDPAVAYYDDGSLSRISTKPNGLVPGLVDEFGRSLFAQMPTGNIAYGMEMQERERQVIKDAFLEQLFEILTDPADRMTATQVLEMVQKQGVLVGPFAGRHETEKLGPMIDRELDLLMNARQIDPMPPEMIEAGITRPLVEYQNPLARMARAEEAAGFTRLAEIITQLAAIDPTVVDLIAPERAILGLAEVFSIRPSWMATADEIAAKRKGREDAQAAAQLADAVPKLAGGALDLAKANELAAA